MKARTNARDRTNEAAAAADLEALDQLRLARNWSYPQLAEDMERAGFPLPAKTLHALLTNRPKPYDRTLYQIRHYLASVDDKRKAAAR